MNIVSNVAVQGGSICLHGDFPRLAGEAIRAPSKSCSSTHIRRIRPNADPTEPRKGNAGRGSVLAVEGLADTTTSAATDDAWLHGRCGRPRPYIRGNARRRPVAGPEPDQVGARVDLAAVDDGRRAFIGEAA